MSGEEGEGGLISRREDFPLYGSIYRPASPRITLADGGRRGGVKGVAEDTQEEGGEETIKDR